MLGTTASVVTVQVAGASLMPVADLEGAVRQAYESLASQLKALPTPHPIRFWNHIPDITRRELDGRDRYMTFNAGRFAAFQSWYGAPDTFHQSLPTASAVGTTSDDLTIHCLAAREPGRPVANPRQLQSFHYSQKFGPLPPCFSRATVVGANLILIGGTASIRGEETLFEKNLDHQLDETIANLIAVMRQATRAPTDDAARVCYRDLRVYLPDIANAPCVESRLRTTFPNVTDIEFLHADLCRAPLMVEIEGIGELTA